MEKMVFDGICVSRFQWDFINSNMYVIEEEKEVLVIDPIRTSETDTYWKAKKYAIDHITILLTHEHFDHINGLNILRDLFSCTVIATDICGRNITDARKNLSQYSEWMGIISEEIIDSGKEIKPFVCKASDVMIERDMGIEWKNYKLELVLTPGHTESGMCVLIDGKLLFTGDSLLKKKIITRLPGGDKKAYKNITAPKIMRLIEHVEYILPGHGVVEQTVEFQEFT